jgi:hypothetical protein
MIVLHKGQIKAHLSKGGCIPALHKEASIITEYARLND